MSLYTIGNETHIPSSPNVGNTRSFAEREMKMANGTSHKHRKKNASTCQQKNM